MLWRILLSVTFALNLSGTAMAGELEEAEAAYWRGDYEKALPLLRSLVEQGDPQAEYYLGFMSERGNAVPQNYQEAAKWYRRAAERGHPHAQNNLGVLYKNGRGVEQDYVQAYQWFSLAASSFLESEEGDRERAVQNRDSLVMKMAAADLDEARKLVREWKRK